MAEYELRRDQIGPNPVVEILRDGEPFWEDLPGAKKHFSFGVKKAKVILASLEVIKEFFDSGGEAPGPGRRIEVCSTEWKVNCVVRYQDGFKRRGRWIDRPYLEIVGEPTIGLGVLKAEAVLALERELRKFMIPYK